MTAYSDNSACYSLIVGNAGYKLSPASYMGIALRKCGNCCGKVKNLFKRSRGDETADIGNNIKNI